MVEKVFWAEPYKTEFTTRVVTAEGNDVTVERTIFYAFSGGQESDTGTIGGCPVLEARKQGHDIVYRLGGERSFQAGDTVTMRIDGARRCRLMRLHFAAELVLELAYQNLDGIEKIGAHIAEDKARVDFMWRENISKALPSLEEAANELIAADLHITSAFSDEAEERRYWEIDGFARVPCGGTHPKRTGEVGDISLKRVNLGKGKERIDITLLDAEAAGGKE